jgi:hypothetical protein
MALIHNYPYRKSNKMTFSLKTWGIPQVLGNKPHSNYQKTVTIWVKWSNLKILIPLALTRILK